MHSRSRPRGGTQRGTRQDDAGNHLGACCLISGSTLPMRLVGEGQPSCWPYQMSWLKDTPRDALVSHSLHRRRSSAIGPGMILFSGDLSGVLWAFSWETISGVVGPYSNVRLGVIRRHSVPHTTPVTIGWDTSINDTDKDCETSMPQLTHVSEIMSGRR